MAATPISLQNPLVMASGQPLTQPAQWAARRQELADLVIGIEYGGMPPTPASTQAELLHQHQVKALGGAQYRSYRIKTGPERAFSFLMNLLLPAGNGPFPVVICGDGCWRYTSEAVATEVLGRGLALATFNRVELAPDVYSLARDSGLYLVYPEGQFGALSAWAWGYHRCVDVLSAMPGIAADKIAVVGHSRGGKTVLLAGATDTRIALTAPNNSGAGGAGSFLWQGPESETLEFLVDKIAYWFGPRLKEWRGRAQELPFDQHFLKALVAPRALLSTEALGDLWANPTGTWQTHLAAREVYKFLGAGERIGIHFRPGGHAHGLEDWRVMLDFMAWQLLGQAARPGYDQPPEPNLAPAFQWSAPH